VDSYIVRIYRNRQAVSGELAGLVETVGTSERFSFRSFPELTSLLSLMLQKDGKAAVVKGEPRDTETGPGRAGLNLIAGHKG